MKGSWWKGLSVILMLYAIVAGFLMPLKPGITSAAPQNINSGAPITIMASTYNAKLSEISEDELRFFLLRDSSYLLEGRSIKILGRQQVSAVFDVPENLPVDEEFLDFSLVIDAPKMGYAILPNNIFVRKGGSDYASGLAEWSKGKLGKLNKHEGIAIPFRNLNLETTRNLYYHVSLWFSMFILFFVSVIYSIRYLRKRDEYLDNVASSLVEVGTLFGILGLVTGSLWAKNTWGAYWTTDVKLNMAAVSMMIYAAYLVLRTSIKDGDKKAVISSSYNIFAFFIIIPLIFVIPRLTDSLHPGNGGNPGFGGDDLDNTMRMVFYPAIIAFTLFGLWMSNLMIRFKKIRERTNEV